MGKTHRKAKSRFEAADALFANAPAHVRNVWKQHKDGVRLKERREFQKRKHEQQIDDEAQYVD